jgi:hypothetical protein
MTRNERLLNALMSRFSIVIENAFAEMFASFPYTFTKYNHKLGSQPVGKKFLVAAIIMNMLNVLYGNSAGSLHGSEMSMLMTLEDLLTL